MPTGVVGGDMVVPGSTRKILIDLGDIEAAMPFGFAICIWTSLADPETAPSRTTNKQTDDSISFDAFPTER